MAIHALIAKGGLKTPVYNVLVPGDEVVAGTVLAECARAHKQDVRTHQGPDAVEDFRIGNQFPGEGLFEVEVTEPRLDFFVPDAVLERAESVLGAAHLLRIGRVDAD